jgi:chemotaxis protein CheX
MASSKTFTLPAALDTGAAAQLANQLTALRGRPLVLDASGVERVGALGLQVLVSAQVTWAQDGKRLGLSTPSAALEAAFNQAGLPHDFLRSA